MRQIPRSTSMRVAALLLSSLSSLSLPAAAHAQAGCAPPATGIRVDTVARDGARVRAEMPGAAAMSGPFEVILALVPLAGTSAPGRTAPMNDSARVDFGPVAAGRYAVMVDTRTYAELTIGSPSVSLCLARWPRSNIVPAIPFISNGPGSPIPGTPAGTEADAIADGLGRWLGTTRRDTLPFALMGTGSWLEAARRGFAVARGDPALPPTDRPAARFHSTVSLFAAGLLAPDSALVIASTGGCWPSALRGGSGGGSNGAYLLVRAQDGRSWLVSQFVLTFSGDFIC